MTFRLANTTVSKAAGRRPIQQAWRPSIPPTRKPGTAMPMCATIRSRLLIPWAYAATGPSQLTAAWRSLAAHHAAQAQAAEAGQWVAPADLARSRMSCLGDLGPKPLAVVTRYLQETKEAARHHQSRNRRDSLLESERRVKPTALAWLRTRILTALAEACSWAST